MSTKLAHARHGQLFRTNIAEIRIGDRHRKDLGDLGPLAESMDQLGLLSPITVTSSRYVICGARRLAAAQKLGWTYIDVIIRADISEPFHALLAERDDEVCRKEYDPVEQATFYREYRKELAVDAALVQAATRFPSGADHPRSRNRRWDGVCNLHTPSDQVKRKGRAATQAARMVGGFGHRTYDKINAIQAVAENPAHSPMLRAEADQALTQIRAAGKIDPLYHRINDLLTLEDLAATANDENLSEAARQSAADALTTLDAANEQAPLTPEGIHQMVKGAQNRVRVIENKNKTKQTPVETGVSERETTRAVNQFRYVATSLTAWLGELEPALIAPAISETELAAFERTIADFNAFAHELVRLREGCAISTAI